MTPKIDPEILKQVRAENAPRLTAIALRVAAALNPPAPEPVKKLPEEVT